MVKKYKESKNVRNVTQICAYFRLVSRAFVQTNYYPHAVDAQVIPTLTPTLERGR